MDSYLTRTFYKLQADRCVANEIMIHRWSSDSYTLIDTILIHPFALCDSNRSFMLCSPPRWLWQTDSNYDIYSTDASVVSKLTDNMNCVLCDSPLLLLLVIAVLIVPAQGMNATIGMLWPRSKPSFHLSYQRTASVFTMAEEDAKSHGLLTDINIR